ncbi:MAG: InlB B-repeat-containing protein [Clostridiales Family XIII bacterium]|nr:InlB B-repeat-containing protein [Clostridiales Family XIII bacterium]
MAPTQIEIISGGGNNNYGITPSAGSNGNINPLSLQSVSEGADQSFTITPNPNYVLDGVAVDDSPISLDGIGLPGTDTFAIDPDTGVGAYTFKNVTENHTIHATFKELPYITVVPPASGGTISPASGALVGGKFYMPETPTDAAFTITPDSGYAIKELKADSTIVTASNDPGSPYTIDSFGVGTYTFKGANENHSLSVTFEDALQISPVSISFGNLHVKDFSETRTVTVYNKSYAPVSVTPPAVSTTVNGTPTTGAFSIEADGYPSVIPAQSQATFDIAAENFPLGEYIGEISAQVGSRTLTLPVTLNSYHRIYNESFDHGTLYAGDSSYTTKVIPNGGYCDLYSMIRPNASDFTQMDLFRYTVDPGYKLTDFNAKFIAPDGKEHWSPESFRESVRNGEGHVGVDQSFGNYGALFGYYDDDNIYIRNYKDKGQGDIYIYADFELVNYDFTQTQTIPAGSNVEVTSVSSGGVESDDFDVTSITAFSDVTFTVTPPRGHHLYTLSDNGNTVGASGFSVDSNGKVTYVSKNVTASHQIVPTFVPNEFAVNFDVNGGIESYGNLNVTFADNYGDLYDVPNTLPAPTHAKGYSFGGWWLKADGKEIGENDAVQEVFANTNVDVGYAHTLYAKWFVPPESIGVTDEDGNDSAAGFTYDRKDGGDLVLYVSGVYDEDASVAIDDFGLKKDTHYTIEQGPDGGIKLTIKESALDKFADGDFIVSLTYADTDGTEATAPVKIKDSTPKPPANPGGEKPDTPATEDDKPNTPAPPATVEDKQNSPSIPSTDDGKAEAVTLDTAGGTKLTAKVGDKLSSVKKPVKKGYTFKGWYTKAKGGAKLADSYVIQKDSKVYAQWTAKKFKVLYRANKGKLKGKAYKTVSYDAKYGKLAKPTRQGYKFAGWYTKAKGGSKITANSKVHILKTTKLYAHWKKK